MMAWTHAMIGAAVGSRTDTPQAAFLAGVVSHGLADLVPHRDYNIPIELPLLCVALASIAYRYGLESRQFWGAVGGFSPDIENGLEVLGYLPGTLYPTHTKKPWFVGHGHKVKSALPQLLIAMICLLVAEKFTISKPE
jgi:hypothetical protein